MHEAIGGRNLLVGTVRGDQKNPGFDFCLVSHIHIYPPSSLAIFDEWSNEKCRFCCWRKHIINESAAARQFPTILRATMRVPVMNNERRRIFDFGRQKELPPMREIFDNHARSFIHPFCTRWLLAALFCFSVCKNRFRPNRFGSISRFANLQQSNCVAPDQIPIESIECWFGVKKRFPQTSFASLFASAYLTVCADLFPRFIKIGVTYRYPTNLIYLIRPFSLMVNLSLLPSAPFHIRKVEINISSTNLLW